MEQQEPVPADSLIGEVHLDCQLETQKAFLVLQWI